MSPAANASLKRSSKATRWVELPIWAVLLVIVLFANLGIVEFSTPVLSAFFFAAIGGIIFSKWKAGSSNAQDMRNFIYVAVLFWVVLDPLLIGEGIDEFKGSVIAETLLYVAVFLTMVSFGYALSPSRTLASAFAGISEPQSGKQVFRAAISLYLIGVTPLLYYSGASLDTFLQILLAGYGSGAEAGWRRGGLGSESDYFFTICFLIFNISPFLALWVLRKATVNPLQKAVLIWIVLSVPLFYFFSGGRRVFGYFVLASLLYLYDAAPSHRQKLWRILFILVPIFLILAMQVQAQFRVSGFYDVDLAVVDTSLQGLYKDDIFHWMLTAVNVMPAEYSFTHDLPFLNLLTHPIPRFLWTEKPVNTGFPWLDWESIGGTTLTISVIGEFYIAQGLLGVVLAGLAYGWAARNWDQLMHIGSSGSAHSLIYYMGGVQFFVVGIRSFGDIVTNWYSVAFLILLIYFLGGFKHPKRAQGLAV
jgi:oligosaccharide repeat unit polymerase